MPLDNASNKTNKDVDDDDLNVYIGVDVDVAAAHLSASITFVVRVTPGEKRLHRYLTLINDP